MKKTKLTEFDVETLRMFNKSQSLSATSQRLRSCQRLIKKGLMEMIPYFPRDSSKFPTQTFRTTAAGRSVLMSEVPA